MNKPAEQTKPPKRTFSSFRGIVIPVNPVSQFKIDTLNSSKRVVPAPTYEIEIVGGAKQTLPMDEKVAESKGRMDEWNAYLTEKKIADEWNTKKFLEFMVWEGVSVEVPDKDSDWQKQCEHFGMDVPEEPISRKLFYVYNEMLATKEDLGNLVADIMSVSKISEEAVTKLRDTFRSGIQQDSDKVDGKGKGKVENK
jgi:hypothetical protein